MKKPSLSAALVLSLGLCATPAIALEAGGIRFADVVSVGGTELQANGAGVRTKFVFDVYAIALYLPAKAGSLDAAAKGPRRVTIHLMRDVKRIDFVAALQDGLKANVAEAELAALAPQVQQFAALIGGEGEVTKGTTVTIDDLPGTGTRVSIGGQPQGKDITGEKFFGALLRVWLGDKPAQADLKARLLGK